MVTNGYYWLLRITNLFEVFSNLAKHFVTVASGDLVTFSNNSRNEFCNRKTTGFTLIELLVTISILALLIGTGIPSFRRFGRVSQLDLGADQIKAALLDARSYALNPRSEKDVVIAGVSSTCQSTQAHPVKTYSIKFDVLNSEYFTYEGDCLINETQKLPPFITVQVPIENQVTFSISDQGRVITPASGEVRITLSHEQITGLSRIVTINRETGAVSVK